MAATVLACLQWFDIEKVFVLIPSKALVRRDRIEYEDYWVTAACQDKITYTSDLDFRLAEKEIAIVDEADYFVLG